LDCKDGRRQRTRDFTADPGQLSYGLNSTREAVYEYLSVPKQNEGRYPIIRKTIRRMVNTRQNKRTRVNNEATQQNMKQGRLMPN
jgi:hypothetical protein